jgi:hypothetical protein
MNIRFPGECLAESSFMRFDQVRKKEGGGMAIHMPLSTKKPVIVG